MTTFSGNSRRAVALLCVAQFVVVLDVTVVTTALPALGHELGFTPQGLTWVVTAYTLCFGGFLVVGGRVADLLGSRRAFTSRQNSACNGPWPIRVATRPIARPTVAGSSAPSTSAASPRP